MRSVLRRFSLQRPCLRGAAMHRNCHLDRAFSLLPRRRLGRMNAADRPTNGLVDSQTSDVGSIRIARSITLMIRLPYTAGRPEIGLENPRFGPKMVLAPVNWS